MISVSSTQSVREASNVPHWTTSLKLHWNSHAGTEKITKASVQIC